MGWTSIAFQSLVTVVTIFVSVSLVLLKSHHDRKLTMIKVRSEKIEHLVFMLLKLKRGISRLRDRNFHQQLLRMAPENAEELNQISSYPSQNLITADIYNISDEIRTIIHFHFVGENLAQRFEKLLSDEFELINNESKSACCISSEDLTYDRLKDTMSTTVSTGFINELDGILNYVSAKDPLKYLNPH